MTTCPPSADATLDQPAERVIRGSFASGTGSLGSSYGPRRGGSADDAALCRGLTHRVPVDEILLIYGVRRITSPRHDSDGSAGRQVTTARAGLVLRQGAELQHRVISGRVNVATAGDAGEHLL